MAAGRPFRTFVSGGNGNCAMMEDMESQSPSVDDAPSPRTVRAGLGGATTAAGTTSAGGRWRTRRSNLSVPERAGGGSGGRASRREAASAAAAASAVDETGSDCLVTPVLG
jgi:hypothetical protein